MRRTAAISLIAFVAFLTTPAAGQAKKHTIPVVSSYHRERLQSQDTQNRLSAGLLGVVFTEDVGVQECVEDSYASETYTAK